MKSPVVKRSIVIAGHKTSVSLEEAFWDGLKEIAKACRLLLSELLFRIDHSRRGNLSSAIRTFVFDYFHAQSPASPGDRIGAGSLKVTQDRPQPLSGA